MRLLTHDMPGPSAVSAFFVLPFGGQVVSLLVFASDSIDIGEASGQRLSPIHF